MNTETKGAVRLVQAIRRLLLTLVIIAWLTAMGGVAPPVQAAAGATVLTPAQTSDWGLEAVGAAAAWERAADLTAAEVTVAILDTGVDAAHPQLAGTVWPGWSLVGGSPVSGAPDDSLDGHGTHVAGLVRRAAGPLPVRLLPVKVLGTDGSGTIDDLAAGIRFAVDWRGPAGERVGVINLSLGFRLGTLPVALAAAVRYALDSDLVVVAAAGNEGRDLAGYFPGALNGVIAVAAVGPDGKPAADSNSGAHVAAPGIAVLSTLPAGKEGTRTGSSFAAPYVSAGAAVLRSVHPGLNRAETLGALLHSPFRLDTALVRAEAVAAPRLDPAPPQNRPQFMLSGRAPAGSTVGIEASQPGQPGSWAVGRGTADRHGRFSVAVALPPQEAEFILTATAVRQGVRGRPSASLVVTLDFTPPEPPAALEARPSPHGLTDFTWAPSPSADLAGYRLTRRGGPSVFTVFARYRFGSPPGRSHTFALVAVDRAGNLSRPAIVTLFQPPARPWFY